MGVRIAINGFGRIGRYLVRACSGRRDIDIVAINSRAPVPTLRHLLVYDSVHRTISVDVTSREDALVVDGRTITVTNVSDDGAKFPWKDLGVDIVLESTGKYRSGEACTKHIEAGARKVIIAAPGKSIDGTFVMGVNEDQYNPASHHIVSNASCTTNCLAPVVKVIHENFGIARGLMTTVHSYTMDQRILDGSHKDLRRARAAALSIIPTTTGAAAAVGEVIPEMKGRLDGIALRVPTPNVSLVDLACDIEKSASAETITEALKAAAAGSLQGIMAVSEEELVSVDFTSSTYSSIVDAPLTTAIDGHFIKVFAWYDNESGYACRMRDLALYMGARL